MDSEMNDFIQSIVNNIFEKFEPELKQAMIQKIISVSLDRWRFCWTNSEEITKLINTAVEQKITTEYKPILDYIADKKAREKILRRAEQNGIPRKEILHLFSKL